MAKSSGKLLLKIWLVTIELFLIPKAISAEFYVSPGLGINQHYTDNLLLEQDALKEEEYVTEIDPGVSILAKGPRLGIDANYTLQNLSYKNNSQFNSRNHKFQGTANSELVKNLFYFDVAGTIDQKLISPDQSVPIDNINVGNRSDVKALSLAPTLKANIENSVQSNLRYVHGIVKIEEGASDSVSNDFKADFNSGVAFSRLDWHISYRNLSEKRETGDRFKLENAFLEARYKLFNSLNLLAVAGYENNDFVSSTDLNNGNYHSFGLGWRPNSKFGVEATYGSNYKSATLVLNPTVRTALNVGWEETDVGVNTGEIWNGKFTLKNRHTQWAAIYQEGTTSTQQLQLTPDAGQTGGDFTEDIGLTDEIFVRKLGRLAVEHKWAKSRWSLGYVHVRRLFKVTEIKQKYYGGYGSWEWSLSPKVKSTIAGGVTKRHLGIDAIVDDFQYGGINIEWHMKKKINAGLELNHTKVVSEVQTREYEENRAILKLNIVFSKKQPEG